MAAFVLSSHTAESRPLSAPQELTSQLPRGDSSAALSQKAPAQEEPLSAAWADAFGKFVDRSLPPEASNAAIRLGYELCSQWMASHRAPYTAQETKDFHALRGAMGLAIRLAEGHVEPERAIAIHRAWFECLTAYCADGAHEDLFAEELAQRVQFVLRYESVAKVEGLLSDATLRRIERKGAVEKWSHQRVLRADIRRTRGAFRQALEDLEVERMRLDAGEVANEGRGAYESVALKIAMDLGLLDRASASLAQLKRLATGTPAGSFEQQRFQLALARYFEANGQHRQALSTATGMLPSGAVFTDLKLELSALQARALVLRALALSKLARTPDERAAAISAIRLERRRLGTDEASRTPLDIELAAALQRTGNPGDRAEAYRAAVAVLARLENGAPSTLFTARAAAQVYGLVMGMGQPDEIERARSVLEDSAGKLVQSWREIGRFDGGIGFLDFQERLAVASAWIGSRLDAPGGPAHALQGLLEIDACSQLSRRLAERCPDSPALAVDVDSLVALTKAHNSHLVWYLPAPDRTHRFTVTATGVAYAALKPLSAYSAPFGRVMAWLRRRPTPGKKAGPDPKVRTDLAWLAAELLPAPFSGPGREGDTNSAGPLPGLWLTGLDPFGHAPFELLPHSSDKALGLTIPVVRLPSLTCAVHWALIQEPTQAQLKPSSKDVAPPHQGPNKRGTFHVFSPPMEHHPSGDISLTNGEIIGLRQASVGNTRFSLSRGPAATRTEFARALGSGSELFVAWTHGEYDPELKRPAGLVVTKPDGDGFDFLDSGFVETVLQRAGPHGIPGAVYLAACDVARGHRRMGDAAASHLGGAFLGAGVPVVVASSEQNDRHSTAVHLREFSLAYLKGKATAQEAMLKARQAVADTPGFAHPHFWVGLQLLGWGPTTRRGR